MVKKKNGISKPAKKDRLTALLLVGLGIFLLIALLSFDAADLTPGNRAPVHNWAGTIGAHLAGLLFTAFGRAAWLVPFLFPLFGVPYFRTGRALAGLKQACPLLLVLLSFLLILPASRPAAPAGPGGSAGSALSGAAVGTIGTFGTYLAGVALLLTGLAILFREPLKRMRQSGERFQSARLEKRARKEAQKKEPKVFQGDRVLFNNGSTPELDKKPLQNEMIFKAGTSRQELLKEFKERNRDNDAPPPFLTRVVIEAPAPTEPDPFTDDSYNEEEVWPPISGESPDYPDDDPKVHIEEVAPLFNEERWEEEQAYAAGDEDPFADDLHPSEPVLPLSNTAGRKRPRRYRTPDSSLLAKSAQIMDDETRRNMQHNAMLLENTFREFGIEAVVTNISRGPVITRFEMSIPPGVKLNRVVALQDNIALNLAAASVRIEAPIPGKSAIGIEVPNKKRSMVTLRDILESEDFRESKALIPIALGQSVSGAATVTDLANMPHLIIAGTTGSGKSVCVNGIICSLLYNMTPAQVRLIMVDPKYVELAPYNGIPHLLIPVINKPRQAIMALKWLVREMEQRYQLLQRLSARNITSFNQKIASGTLPPPEDRSETEEPITEMPYLVVIIDELADLMILAKKEIEDSISRLAAMSRAVGIHLIFATQRPSVDVLTGVIKNNFPARIAFQVASSTDSRTILDANGADKLLGKGDSLFIGPGSPFPVRIQGAFLSEEEVDKTTEYLRSLGEPEYRMEILETGTDEDTGGGMDGDYEEPLFKEAVDIVVATKRASASYLQRRLKVGYNRAARMVEMMEEEGIIGPQQGSKPREVLMPDWKG